MIFLHLSELSKYSSKLISPKSNKVCCLESKACSGSLLYLMMQTKEALR